MESTAKILNRIEELEAFVSMTAQHLTVLKKELEGSGAPTGSARKGNPVLSPKEVAKIKAKRQKARMRKVK